MTLPHVRVLIIAVALTAGAGLACGRPAKDSPSSAPLATIAAPAVGALEGHVTVRIAWRGRLEPPRAAHLIPAHDADAANSLEFTIEAPDPMSRPADAAETADADDTADACEALPADLRTRTFAATIDDVAPSADPMSVFSTSRNGPPHSTPYRTVVVEGPTIQEQVSPTTFLAIDGSGARSLATANPTAVTVPWSGDFETCELRAPGASDLGCAARPDQILRRSVCHFTNALLTIRRR